MQIKSKKYNYTLLIKSILIQIHFKRSICEQSLSRYNVYLHFVTHLICTVFTLNYPFEVKMSEDVPTCSCKSYKLMYMFGSLQLTI